jgi:hypothetical protein
MTKKPLIKRFGSVRPKNAFLIFRVAAIVVIVGVFAVFGFAVKNTLALSWSEPATNPPDLTGINGPVWAQTAASQTGGLWVTGKGRFDTAGTGDANCTGAKLCGVDNAAVIGLSGESATGVGLYASSGSASSYAGAFNGNVYLYPTYKLGVGVAPSYPVDVVGNVNSSTGFCIAGSCINAWPGGITGGTTNYLPKYTSATTIGLSQLFDNGTAVGIATTSPAGILNIATTGTSNAIAKISDYPANSQIRFGGTGGNSTKMALVYDGQGGGGAAHEFGRGAGGWDTYQAFYTNTGTATSGQMFERVRIDPSGNVGIGTSVPNTQLHLDNAGNVGPQITLSAPGGGTPGIIFRPYQSSGQWSNPAQASITATDNNYSANIHFYTKIPGAIANALTERMTIQNNGAIGISNTAPSALLTLGTAGTTAGTLSFAGATSGVVTIDTLAAAGTWSLTLPPNGGAAGQYLQTDGAGNATWQTVSSSGITCGATCTAGYHAKFLSASTVGNGLIYDTGTYVGIGTASPTYTLQVAGTMYASGAIYGYPVYSNGYAVCQSNGTNCLSGGSVSGSGNQYYVAKFTSTGSSIGNSMIYDNGSYVGINTSSPGTTLDVNGTIRGTSITTTGSIYATTTIMASGSITSGNTVTANTLQINGTANAYTLQGTNLNVTGTTTLAATNMGYTNATSLTTGGGVTVGTNLTVNGSVIWFGTSGGWHYLSWDGTNYNFPSGGLTVGGAISSGAISAASLYSSSSIIASGYISSSSYMTASGTITSGASNQGGFYQSSTNNGYANFYANWSTSDWWGIGPRSNGSDRTLYMGGASSTGAWNNNSVTLVLNGVIWTNGYQSNSDRRLKDSIASLDDNYGLNIIDQLNPVSYVFKSDIDKSVRYGFIAQDVEKVLPNIVAKDPSTSMLSLRYDDLIAPMVKSIQEQQAQIKDLQKQIDELKAEIK